MAGLAWDDEECECHECGGEGCSDCDDEDEGRVQQCCGITLRGTRCQITSDSIYSHIPAFSTAASFLEPLSGGRFCGMHLEQEHEGHT
jgi:hypothetical protein